MRRRDLGAIDWDNVIEEVETLGRGEKSFWTSPCANVFSHLLKIEHSAGDKHVDGRDTIVKRTEIGKGLLDSMPKDLEIPKEHF